MNSVNYFLMFKGNSDKGGVESSVRGFSRLENAQAAMVAAYKRMAASYDIPVSSNVSANPYTIKTKNSIRLERYGDWFQWEITKAVPEDGDSSEPGVNEQWCLRQFTVTIEEHIAQEFQVNAYNIFQAIDFAEQKYKCGKFVVQPSTPNARLIMARDEETGNTTEWKALDVS